MMYFEPEHSPWGQVDHCETIYPGVFSVSTPSHGGIMVRREIEKELLSASARKIGFTRLMAYKTQTLPYIEVKERNAITL